MNTPYCARWCKKIKVPTTKIILYYYYYYVHIIIHTHTKLPSCNWVFRKKKERVAKPKLNLRYWRMERHGGVDWFYFLFFILWWWRWLMIPRLCAKSIPPPSRLQQHCATNAIYPFFNYGCTTFEMLVEHSWKLN